MLPVDPEPDSTRPVLRVGQDAAGHWLVQQDGGGLEGRFVSLAAAATFAHAEAQSIPNATIVRALTPIVPSIPFAPVEPWETALTWRRAA